MTKELFYFHVGVINFKPELISEYYNKLYYTNYFKLDVLNVTKRKIDTLFLIFRQFEKEIRFTKSTYNLLGSNLGVDTTDAKNLTAEVDYCRIDFQCQLHVQMGYDWIDLFYIQFTEDEVHLTILGNFHKEFFYYNPETMLPDNNFKLPNPYWKENKIIIDNFLNSIKEGFKEYGIREMTEEEALS